mgnify:CR=1 FL=1
MSSSVSKTFNASTKLVPAITSPPIPMQRLCPTPALVREPTVSYDNVPDFAMMPMWPGKKVGKGWKPILQRPMAEMIPGAFAPTSRDLDCVFNMECI